MTIRLINREWYYNYIKKEGKLTLSDIYTEEEVNDGLLISLRYKGSKLFSLFRDYIEFLEYNDKVIESKRCFFEVILGQKKQKPRFDIDIEKVGNLEEMGNKVVTKLINTFVDIIQDIDFKKDLMIFTSHSDTKRSFHIVINNYYHNNNLEAREFYNIIKSKIDGKYSKYIDHAVYSKFQQFRVLGSQKEDSNRPKIQLMSFKKLTFSPVTFRESLVTYTKNCKYIKGIVVKESLCHNIDGLDLSSNTIDEIMKLIPDETLTISNVKGQMIMLRNNKGYYCSACDTTHEHENPFMLLIGNSVFFNCRRYENNGRGKLIGHISDNVLEEQQKIYEDKGIKPKLYIDGIDIDEIDSSDDEYKYIPETENSDEKVKKIKKVKKKKSKLLSLKSKNIENNISRKKMNEDRDFLFDRYFSKKSVPM